MNHNRDNDWPPWLPGRHTPVNLQVKRHDAVSDMPTYDIREPDWSGWRRRMCSGFEDFAGDNMTSINKGEHQSWRST